jgi:hypothetical protein
MSSFPVLPGKIRCDFNYLTAFDHMVEHYIDDDLHAFTLRLSAQTFEFRFRTQLAVANGSEANRLIK